MVHKKHMELLDVSGAAGEAGLREAEEKRIWIPICSEIY